MKRDSKPGQKKGLDDYDDDDSSETFHSSLWKMPTLSLSSIPIIALNEEAVIVPDLELFSSSAPTVNTTASDKSDISELMTNFDSSANSQGSESDISALRQRLIRKKTNPNLRPGATQHLKMWRRKLLILIWLDFLMRYRKRFLTFVEVIFPVIALGVICGSMVLNNTWTVTQASEGKTVNADSPFSPFNPISQNRLLDYVCSNNGFCDDDPEKAINDFERYQYIVYAPNNSFVNKLMDQVKKTLNVDLTNKVSKFFGVATSSELEKLLLEQWNKQSEKLRYPYGVVFSFGSYTQEFMTQLEKGKTIPKELRYWIRTLYPETANTAENFPFVEHSAKARTRHEISPYIFTGFSGLQFAIDIAFMTAVAERIKTEVHYIPNVGKVDALLGSYKKSPILRMFEYPVFLTKDVRLSAWTTVVLSIIISYACTNFSVVQDIGHEAKAGKVELLKLHGMTPALHWISYAINMGVFAILTSLLLAIIIYYCFAYQSIIPYLHVTIVWLFFLLFLMAQYAENVFMVLFFSSPTTAGMASFLKSVASFLLPMILFKNDYLSRTSNFFLCLFLPEWCLANGLYVYLNYEIFESGIEWFDFPVLLDTENYVIMSLPISCILFIYSITIYLMLTIFCDRIISKPYAPSVSWKNFWKTYREPKPENQKPSPPINYKDLPQMYEHSSSDLLCTIKIRNLCKTVDSEKSYELTLDNISLDIFEGEILAVVGLAGAGKTNLLHLIAGLSNPSSGYVEVKNLKVHEYSDFLNQFISICPQKCMLFPTLSVEDHVRLCCMVHGNSYKKSKVQAKLLLQLFGLQGAKRHNYHWLSDVQIKKLEMAMALASSPTILILDEPCQGMDPETTKQLWRYLLSLKPKRTIIVSTSRMEDIELYCDKMLMLVKGKAVCYGTPNKIRRHYDIGFVVNIQEGGVTIDTDALQKIVSSEVKGAMHIASLDFQTGFKTRRFLLPYAQPYAALIERIEDSQSELDYKKIWISRVEIGTFLHKISLGKGIESSIATKEDFITDAADELTGFRKIKLHDSPQMPKNPETSSFKQFRALFMKKWLVMTQNDKKYSLLLVPIIFMALITAFAPHFLQFTPESLPLPIRIKNYNNSLTLIKPSTPTGIRNEWYKAYFDALGKPDPDLAIAAQYVDSDKNIGNEIIKRKELTLTNFREQTIVAVEQDGDITTGYYSSNSYHSCPIALNIMNNGFLYMLSRKKTDPYKIITGSHPLHPYQGFPAGSTQSNSVILYGYILSVLFALVAAAEMRLPIWERHNGMKTLEAMAGVRPAVYWMSNALGDFILNVVVVIVLMGTFCLVDIAGRKFIGEDEKGVFGLIMFAYLCYASIPYSYFLTCFLKTSHNGYTHFLILHLVLGIFPKSIVYQVYRVRITGFPQYLRYILHIFPPYTITSALVNYLNTLVYKNYCKQMNTTACTSYENVIREGSAEELRASFEKMYSDRVLSTCCTAYCEPEGTCHKSPEFVADSTVPLLRADLIAMAFQGLFYWTILIMTENKLPQTVYFFFKTRIFGDKELKSCQDDARDTEEPEDVKKEHQRVDYMIDIEDTVDSEIFLVQDLTKFYRTKKCIDHVYFSVPLRKTTGILGIPKSGMTTLLQLLTAQLRISAGNIYMDNERMTNHNKRHCTMKIGLCLEENSFYPHLTGFQMLQLFGKLRGVPDSDLDVQVRRWLVILDLESVARVRCLNYRPGVLRRLCCALAMIGWSRVVIMDQPTKWMDLRERNIFWQAVEKAKQKGQTTLFTSTYIDEVNRCTDKSMILHEGQIVTIGTAQEVFKDNPRGFFLYVRCRSQTFKKLTAFQVGAKVDQLRDHIIRHLSPCELLMDEENILIYQLKDLTMKLSYAYGILEGARETYPNLLDNFLIASTPLNDMLEKLHKRPSKGGKKESVDEEDEDDQQRQSSF